MGRELRMVPKDWIHPIDAGDKHVPLHDGNGYRHTAATWLQDCIDWSNGMREERTKDVEEKFFWDYDGGPPMKQEHMLVDVPIEQRTHYMLYETTSEGTPCNNCPAFETLEALCAWAEMHASTFADYKASKEEWMRMLSDGFVSHTKDMGGIKMVFV